MKTKLVCLLLCCSSTAFAQNVTTDDEVWEEASLKVPTEHIATTQNMFEANDQLELSHPWHYGRQDSDTLIGRDRKDEHHD